MNIVNSYSSSDEEPQQATNKFITMTPKLYNLMQREKSKEVQQEQMEEGNRSIKVTKSKPLITPGSEQITKHQDINLMQLPKSDYHFKTIGNAQVCAIPKKCIFTYSGHKKGVNCSRFFPNYGHLFVSGSNDCTIKIWDVYRQKQCIATMTSHNKGVRDLNWSHTGGKLISASFDKYVKIFDIRKEKPLFNWTVDRIPYVVVFHPQKENIFLVGCGDRKIYQVDSKANEIVHTYAEHKGQINSISFFGDGLRFASTADDKSLKIYELNSPMAIAHKSEPNQHSLSSVVMHPDGEWILCQSFSNSILCFGSSDKYRISKKRKFVGHDIASYGCTINTSPDGKFVLSGDSHGKCFIWNWKNQKLLTTFTNHKQVVMDCQWHPQEPSKVMTASWDTTIKLYE